MNTLAYKGKSPKIHSSAFIADTARVIGDVEIGEDSSIWFGVVVRGDVNRIRIGARSNIQDNSVVHVTDSVSPTTIGDDVTVGHRVVLHGCTLKSGCLVGMGAIVMDDAVVGEGAMVAAGSLVPRGMEIPPGMVAFGAPAKVRRPTREIEAQIIAGSPGHYVEISSQYKKA